MTPDLPVGVRGDIFQPSRRDPLSSGYGRDVVAVVAGSVEHEPGGGFGSLVLGCG